MDAVLHRIEALPGEGRYSVTFRRIDGGEQAAVAQLRAGIVEVAESSLPAGWSLDSDLTRATLDAVVAVDAARTFAVAGPTLRDVEGGWDVGLGNVVSGPNGTPHCTAHEAMTESGGVWTCPECGARALVA